MGGLAVLFFIVLYLVIAFKVVGKFKASRYKWLAVALVILIPSGDAVVGRVYLKYLCAKEGGLKVYRVAEKVDGFMDDAAVTEYWAKELGYQFVEGKASSGNYFRYTKNDDKFIREDKVSPISKYRVRSLHIDDTRNLYMSEQYQVENISTGEILATNTQIGFNGGWAERFLAQFSDAGGGGVAWCWNVTTDPINRHNEVILGSLKP